MAEAEAQQRAAEAAEAAAAQLANGRASSTTSDSESESGEGVPKIVVDQQFVDEDREPDAKTEELLKARNTKKIIFYKSS